jgi:hypothetical protein
MTISISEIVKSSITGALTLHAVAHYRAAKIIGARASLGTIADFHASDKGMMHGYGKWPFPGHGYTKIYERVFRPLRAQPIRLLEVGIGVEGPNAVGSTVFARNRGGASLKVWYDFFPKARIYGIDLNTARFLENDRVSTLVGDQSSRESLLASIQTIGEKVDIIIDDGSHVSRHQQLTLAALFPRLLKKGGIYIVEDLNWQPPWLEGATDVKTTDMLTRYRETGKMQSEYIGPEDTAYIESNLASAEVLFSKLDNASIGILRHS